MSLRERLLDAIIDGQLGNGIVITRQEFITHFPDINELTTGCFLSNSEIETGSHSPTYNHFTMRIGNGIYRIHPQAIQERMQQRNLI
jgi:hypothetical protein